MQGILKVDEFITHRFPLENILDAFQEMHDGNAIR
jgi:Zn-dependent alcohol dehydrogenase